MAIQNLTHDGRLTIAVATSRYDKNLRHQELLWSQLVEKLREPVRSKETLAEFLQFSKAVQDDLKDCGGFVGGVLKDGRKRKGHAMHRQLVTLDIDEPAAADDMLSLAQEKLECAYALHSTRKHQPSKPRLRLIIPLAKAVPAEQYEPIARRIAGDFDIQWFDLSTYQLERLMYWPSISEGAEFLFHVQDAPWLDPDAVLARYPDWRDTSLWPRSSRESQIRKRQAKKQGDPHTKPGTVGLFCRTYSVSEAIESFLCDVYEPNAGSGRYTFIGGSTTGGLVLYDDGKFAFSHHGSDPIGSQLANVFDLIRVHRFGHLDDGISEEVEIAKRPSHLAMVEFADKDPKVQETLRQEREEAIRQDFDGAEVDPQDLFFHKNRFVAMYMADWFLRNHEAIVLQDELYVYQDGRYVPGERIFREAATTALRTEFQSHRLNEALHYLKNTVEQVSPDEAVETGQYLNVRNGLLRLDTHELEPHRSSHKTIVQLPVAYDPQATCPAIDEFLDSILGSEEIRVVEETAGYCLSPSMKHEKVFLLHGNGGNGKGTLIALLTALLGDTNVSAVPLQNLAENRFLSAELFAKMLNGNADIPQRLIEDSSLLKALASGDLIQAERKHKAPFSFRNRAKLLFSTNGLPKTKDHSHAFHRRIVILPFERKFDNQSLRRRLFAPSELQGFLNRALRGLKRLEQRGRFLPTAKIDQAGRLYRVQNDSALLFVSEYCCAVEGSEVSKQHVYNVYRGKCSDWGLQPFGQARFNKTLQEELPNLIECRVNKIRYWRGLKLDDHAEEFLI